MNRNLGAGNFFWHARRIAPDGDERILFYHSDNSGSMDDTRAYSLNELWATVDRYVSWYAAHGVGPGTIVGLYTAHGLRGLLHHIAITSLGGVDALANPNLDPPVAAGYFNHSRATAVIGDAERLAACGADLPDGALTADLDTVEEQAPPSTHPRVRPPYRHRDDDLVMISHSSGTTGRPKPTSFTHRGFFVGKRERLWRFPSRRADRLLTALPHSHSAGISYLSLALLLGMPTLMVDDRTGHGVAAAMNYFRPTIVLGFPLSLAELPIGELSQPASTAVHTWMGMGDASHERHIRPLVELGRTPVRGGWHDGSTYVDGLGSSEMGMVLFKNPHTAHTSNYQRMIGRPVPVVRDAAALGPNGEKLPDGQVGLLGVRTPSVTPGYWDNPELTAEYRSGGYFLTGDVVRRDESGIWYHLDRTPDVIATADGPVYSLPLEEIVLNATGALDAAVVAVDDPAEPGGSRPVAVVLADPQLAGEDPDQLISRCNAALRRAGLAELRALVLTTERDGVPIGVTGKVLKRVLRERYRGLLSEPAPPPGAVLAGTLIGGAR